MYIQVVKENLYDCCDGESVNHKTIKSYHYFLSGSSGTIIDCESINSLYVKSAFMIVV